MREERRVIGYGEKEGKRTETISGTYSLLLN